MVTGILAVIGALDAIAVVLGIAHYRLLGRIGATAADVDASHARQTLVADLQGLAYLAAAVVFIAWLYRAYRNLPALGSAQLRFRPGWAIGGWFVPIMNLWRPKQIMNDVWRASDPRNPSGQAVWRHGRVPAVFQVWWGSFVVSNWAGTAAYLVWREADSVGEVRACIVVAGLANVVELAAAACGILVVRRATARQEERAARVARPG